MLISLYISVFCSSSKRNSGTIISHVFFEVLIFKHDTELLMIKFGKGADANRMLWHFEKLVNNRTVSFFIRSLRSDTFWSPITLCYWPQSFMRLRKVRQIEKRYKILSEMNFGFGFVWFKLLQNFLEIEQRKEKDFWREFSTGNIITT